MKIKIKVSVIAFTALILSSVLAGCNGLKSRKAYSIDGIYIGDYISREVAQKLIDYTWKCSDLSCVPELVRADDKYIEYYMNFKTIDYVTIETKRKNSSYEVSISKDNGSALYFILSINDLGVVEFIRYGEAVF
jgi:hypothetical protein